jgi:coenzyme F420 hydrogenase subunit beta
MSNTSLVSSKEPFSKVNNVDIEKIVQSGLCSGCGLCAGITDSGKIDMEISVDGFLRPTKKSVLTEPERQAIEATCPGITLSHETRRADETADNVVFDPYWGPVVASRLGHSSDAEMRRAASSGGALSSILLYLTESATVDFVVQVGMSKAKPYRNEIFESRTRNEILDRAGSRYSPAAPMAELREALKMPGRFAIVGKPCDIAGLRNYLRRNPELNERIPVLISFFCAGVPSEAGTLELLKALDVNTDDLASFKYRGDGWPGFATATTHDGVTHQMDYDTSWGTILNRHLQFRCKICPEGSGEFADIVCADGWHIGDDGKPDFSEREGLSVLLSRTTNGERIVQSAIEAGCVTAPPLELDQLAVMQPFQRRRKQIALSRLAALVLLRRPIPRFRGLGLWHAVRKGDASVSGRNFIGMLMRLLRLRRST